MVNKLNVTPKTNYTTNPSIPATQKITASEYNNVTDKINEVIDEQVTNTDRALFSKNLTENTIYKKNDYLPTKFKLGVNLEEFGFGSHEPGVMGTDYFNITPEVMDFWIERGITQFRIAFLWERIQPTLNGDLDATHLAELKAITDYALSQNCEVILDLHNYAQYKIDGVDYQIGSAEVPNSAFIDVWLKLSENYGNNPLVQYCIMNEPVKITGNDSFTAELWAGFAQELVYVLRNNNYSNRLQIPGVFFTGAHSWFDKGNAKAFDNFADPFDNFVIEVHQYNDDGADGGGDQSISSVIEPERNLTLFTDWCRRKGFKAHLGETNVPYDDEIGLQSLYENLVFMSENSDVWESLTLWGCGGSWSSSYKYAMYVKSSHPLYPNEPPNLKKLLDFRNRPKPNNDVLVYCDFSNQKYYGVNHISDVLSITRESKGYARNKDGSFVKYNNNEFRLSDQGLLIEPQRTNMVKPYNYDILSLTYFVKENVDFEKGIDSPDGNKNAVHMIDTGSDSEHWTKLKAEFVPGTKYAASVYAKYIDFNYAWITLQPTAASSVKIYDFRSPPKDSGWKEWTKMETVITAVDNDFSEYFGFGFQPDTNTARGDIPDAYTGIGSKIGYWHPQIEDNADYASSPIIGNALSNTREKDDVSIIGDTLTEGIQKDCTIIIELRDLPVESVDLDILSFDGTTVLKRNANSSMETSLGGVLTTTIVSRSNVEGLYRKSVGLSINRTTGDVVLYQQGADPVSGNSAISATTNVKLEPCGGYISKLQVVNRPMNSTELKSYVNSDTSWKSNHGVIGVVANNRVARGTVNNSTDNAFGFVAKQKFGVDTAELKVAFPGWYADSTGMDQNLPNNYTIQEVSLEYNSVVVPVEFHYRDSRSVTVVAGDDKIETKEISPLLFGVDKFTRNSDIIIKGRGTVTAGNSIPYMEVYDGDSGVNDIQFFFYDTGSTTLSSTDETGAYTAVTGTLNTVTKGLSPWVIGKPTHPLSPSYIALGDDITMGTGDTDRGVLGRSYANAAMQDGSNTNTYPLFNCGVSSVTALEYANASRIFTVIAPLCNQAIEQLGSEDLGTSGTTDLATMQTRVEAIWSLLSDNGIDRIHRISLGLQTTSTDDWTTVANQTVSTGWGNGGVAELFNTWLATKVADETITTVTDIRDLLNDETETDKWDAPKLYNNDGFNLNNTGHTTVKIALRTNLDNNVDFEIV